MKWKYFHFVNLTLFLFIESLISFGAIKLSKVNYRAQFFQILLPLLFSASRVKNIPDESIIFRVATLDFLLILLSFFNHVQYFQNSIDMSPISRYSFEKFCLMKYQKQNGAKIERLLARFAINRRGELKKCNDGQSFWAVAEGWTINNWLIRRINSDSVSRQPSWNLPQNLL